MESLTNYYLLCSTLNKHHHIISDLKQNEINELIGKNDLERFFRRKGTGYVANESFIGGADDFFGNETADETPKEGKLGKKSRKKYNGGNDKKKNKSQFDITKYFQVAAWDADKKDIYIGIYEVNSPRFVKFTP